LRASDRRLSETPSHTSSRRFGIQVSRSSKFYREGIIQEGQKKKAPKGYSKSPWSLHIGSFRKVHFINPPEVHGQVVGLVVQGQDKDGNKIPKFPIWVNRKIEYNVIYPIGSRPNYKG